MAEHTCHACECADTIKKPEHHHDHAHDHNHAHKQGIDKRAIVLYAIAVALFVTALTPVPAIVQVVAFGACILLAGYDLLWNGLSGLVKLKFEEDTLMTIAAVAAFALGEYPEACMVVLLFKIGEFLEQIAVARSRKNVRALTDIRPDSANIIEEDGTVVTVEATTIQIGNTILVRVGDKVPLDCVVLTGNSAIDSSALTGESVPIFVEPGSELLSGSINTSGALTCRVTKDFANSTASQIIDLVYSSAEKKGKTEKFITKFSKYYTPIVIACGVLLAIIPPLLGILDFQTWIMRSLIFLVASCPCALVISVPLSFFSSIGAISKQGVLIKGTKYVEILSKVNCVALDKTGTLTSGVMEVQDISLHNGFDQSTVFPYVATIESYSNHPISAAICRYVGTFDKVEATELQEIAGLGIHAIIHGKQVVCGNKKLLDQCGIQTEFIAASYICIDQNIAGTITLKEVIPPDHTKVVEQLKAVGVTKVVMLTGDSQQAAQIVADQCGIDEYHASLLPQNKVEQVEQLKNSHSTVAFIGDGINDAPVLTSANLGISMGLGSEVANSSSDIVLMGNKLSSLPKAIYLAKRSMNVIKFNIGFALTVKFLVIILVALGYAPMWAGIFADTGVTILAMLNAVRIFSFSRK